MDRPQKGPPWSTSAPSRPNNNSALRCIQQGLGCSVEWAITNRCLWSPEEATHHINYLELLAAFLAMKAFGKVWQNITVLFQMDNISCKLHQSERGDSLSTTVSISPDNLDLVCQEECNSHSRTSIRLAELKG